MASDWLTLPRSTQQQHGAPALRRRFNQVRHIIETVHGQLTEQFQIEINHAHSFTQRVPGVCSRVYTTLAAHTVCIYLNRLLGNPEWLRIKHVAFPA